MQRGAIVLVVQSIVALGLTGIGLWTLLVPKNFQAFVHENFALLPAAGPGLRITPVLLRIFGIFLLWYAYTFASAFGREIAWLAWLFRWG